MIKISILFIWGTFTGCYIYHSDKISILVHMRDFHRVLYIPTLHKISILFIWGTFTGCYIYVTLIRSRYCSYEGLSQGAIYTHSDKISILFIWGTFTGCYMDTHSDKISILFIWGTFTGCGYIPTLIRSPILLTVLVGGMRRSPAAAERNWEWPALRGKRDTKLGQVCWCGIVETFINSTAQFKFDSFWERKPVEPNMHQTGDAGPSR